MRAPHLVSLVFAFVNKWFKLISVTDICSQLLNTIQTFISKGSICIVEVFVLICPSLLLCGYIRKVKGKLDLKITCNISLLNIHLHATLLCWRNTEQDFVRCSKGHANIIPQLSFWCTKNIVVTAFLSLSKLTCVENDTSIAEMTIGLWDLARLPCADVSTLPVSFLIFGSL